MSEYASQPTYILRLLHKKYIEVKIKLYEINFVVIVIRKNNK